MLNIVWPIFIIISFSFAIFTGNLENLNNSIFQGTNEIARNIADINMVAIDTEEKANITSKAADELVKTSEQLEKLVGNFKL